MPATPPPAEDAPAPDAPHAPAQQAPAPGEDVPVVTYRVTRDHVRRGVSVQFSHCTQTLTTPTGEHAFCPEQGQLQYRCDSSTGAWYLSELWLSGPCQDGDARCANSLPVQTHSWQWVTEDDPMPDWVQAVAEALTPTQALAPLQAPQP